MNSDEESAFDDLMERLGQSSPLEDSYVERLEKARADLDDALERIEETGPSEPDPEDSPEAFRAAQRVVRAAARVQYLEAMTENEVQ